MGKTTSFGRSESFKEFSIESIFIINYDLCPNLVQAKESHTVQCVVPNHVRLLLFSKIMWNALFFHFVSLSNQVSIPLLINLPGPNRSNGNRCP